MFPVDKRANFCYNRLIKRKEIQNMDKLERLAIKWCTDELTDDEVLFILLELPKNEKNFIQFKSYIKKHAVVCPQKKGDKNHVGK